MAKHHQHLSAYQQGIVRRFYQHRDTVLRARLAELVSEIYLASGPRALDRLWASARDTLAKAGADAGEIDAVCGPRDVESLARIVTALEAPAPRASPARPPADARDDF